jgi:hypothetical protein
MEVADLPHHQNRRPVYMNISKKIQNMAVFLEFLVSTGLAVFFHLVLGKHDVAYIIFGVGVLISFATYLLREDIEKTRHDLSDQYHQAHELTFALAQICDAECKSRAQDLLAGTKRTLQMLQQGYIPLDEGEFYLEGARCVEGTRQRIKAVDPITSGWLTRGVLVNFYQSNVRALERSVIITRIFVMSREEMLDTEIQKVLLTQYNDGVEVRIAFRDELPSASVVSGRDTDASCDFAIYDDLAATEVFPQSGTYFGRKATQAAAIERYLRLYDLVEHSSHAVVVEEGKIILAAEQLKLAA